MCLTAWAAVFWVLTLVSVVTPDLICVAALLVIGDARLNLVTVVFAINAAIFIRMNALIADVTPDFGRRTACLIALANDGAVGCSVVITAFIDRTAVIFVDAIEFPDFFVTALVIWTNAPCVALYFVIFTANVFREWGYASLFRFAIFPCLVGAAFGRG